MIHSQNSVHRVRSRRSRVRKTPVSVKEKWIVGFVVVQLTLALWAIGLNPLWSQLLFMCFSIAGLVLCLLPQQVDLRFQDVDQSTVAAWSRLKRFPVFWSGLLLIIYILIQALNHSHGYHENSEVWELFGVTYLEFLPSGLPTPFFKMNPFRALLIVTGVWMFVCYAWVGLRRQRSFVFVLWCLVINVVPFAVLSLLQRGSGTDKIFWLVPTEILFRGGNFLGTMPYLNRGAALVYLLMILLMAFYFFLLREIRYSQAKSGPHIILLPILVLLYGTLWVTSSRAGILVGSGFMFAFLILFLANLFEKEDATFLKMSGWIGIVIVGVFAVFGFSKLPTIEQTLRDFAGLEKQIESAETNTRLVQSELTWEMFEARKWYGWGAGSWRYVFRYFQPKAEVFNRANHPVIFQYSHNNWFQVLSELGIIGSVIMLSICVWPLLFFLFNLLHLRVPHFVLILGLSGVALHAFVDTLFQNMSIATVIGFIFVMLGKFPLRKGRKV